MATFPARGQKAPQFWDQQLKAYIDALGTLINGGATDLSGLTTTAQTDLVAAINEVKAGINEAPHSLPSYVGERAKSFDPVLSLYNGERLFQRSMNAFGQGLAKTAIYHLCVMGDSIAQGYATQRRQSWPDLIAPGDTEWIPATTAAGSVGDDRVAYAGTWDQSQMTVSNGSAQDDFVLFTFTKPGRYIDLTFLHNFAETNFNYQVDGGSVVNVVRTVQDYGAETITIDAGSTGMHNIGVLAITNIALVGVGIRNTSGGGIYVHNMAISGTKTADWQGAPSYGVNPVQAMAALGGSVWINLGVNDLLQGVSLATFKLALQSLVGSFVPWVDVGLTVSHFAPANVDVATWKTFISAMYDIADAANIPIIDMAHQFGEDIDAGVLADGTHQNVAGQRLWARAMSRALAVGVDERIVSQGAVPTMANLPAGTTITVVKSGGVWPARPTARADITVMWKGADPSPAIVASGTGGMLDNVDVRLVTP